MKKIISSILVASFILATCAINVMAAPATRKVSVSASPATDVKAGDTVTVTVSIDSDNLITAAGYSLKFDSNIFAIDTSENAETLEANFIDVDWYNEITTKTYPWKRYMSDPTFSSGDNYIMAAWSGNKGGIPEASASTDTVIGVYKLTVKDGVTATSTKLTLDEFGMLTAGENDNDTVTADPFTINFKSTEPTVTPWEVAITAEPKYENGYIWKADTTKGDGNLTKFDVTFTDADSNTLTRSILSSDKSGTFDWNVATTFYVGLKTARTVTAAWDIAAKDGDKDVPVTLK